ncbi:MAG TPA: DUF6526 family protein [Paludibaculum sp.]|jgi:hypothetical protein
MEQQNFQNHSQNVKGYLALAFVLVLSIIGSGVNLYHSWGNHDRFYSAALLFVLMWLVFFTAYYARAFALKAQDRGVRAEENLRHFVLTGKLLDPRLTIQQVIGLRFASDAEFVELAKKAADTGMAMNDIKKAVKNWRGDYHRV